MNKNKIYLTLSVLTIGLIGCKKEAAITPGGNLADWTESSHSNNAEPNYAQVFNDNEVQRIDIVIGEEYWNVMQADLASLTSSSGGGPGGGGPGGGGPGGGGGAFSDENPIYVPCQFYYNNKQWYDVGIRYKGNSSLYTAFNNDIGKLPFRLEFNHFEDENPEIWGQTFYGFQQLSLSSGFNDESCIREKVTADVFRDFGVPAPRTAFYRVYVDHGEGPTYFGLYTMVEVVFDTMIEEQFTGGGNCYKPDEDGARLNDLSTITSSYISNKTGDENDMTEVTNLVAALIDDSRTTDPSQWRTNLEQVLDINEYLKYLAANTVIANWDTYGKMTHNYYLYANPADGKINWIPWDNNEALTTTGPQTPLDIDFSNLTNTNPASDGTHTWPMIDYIYGDATYKTMYDGYVDDFLATSFDVSAMTTRMTDAHNLVEPYVIGSEGELEGYSFVSSSAAFTNALTELVNHVSGQWSTADAYTP